MVDSATITINQISAKMITLLDCILRNRLTKKGERHYCFSLYTMKHKLLEEEKEIYVPKHMKQIAAIIEENMAFQENNKYKENAKEERSKEDLTKIREILCEALECGIDSTERDFHFPKNRADQTQQFYTDSWDSIKAYKPCSEPLKAKKGPPSVS